MEVDRIYMNAVVYELVIGKKKQIGSTSRLEKRIREHRVALEAGNHCNQKIQNAYNKYKSFEFRVLSYHETREQAYIEEQRLLDIYFNSRNYLMLNSKATVPPLKKGKQNPFSKREVIDKLRKTKIKKGSYKKSQEVKDKISLANKGRKQSKEEVEKRKQKLKIVTTTDSYKTNHKKGCLEGQRKKTVEAKYNSTKLFKENNPSYKVQACNYCKKNIQGASAFKRFHGENCKLKNLTK